MLEALRYRLQQVGLEVDSTGMTLFQRLKDHLVKKNDA
jgi:hypothetical protein